MTLVGGEEAPLRGTGCGDDDLEALYEAAPCGYLSTLDDGTIVRVNQTLLGWLGYERDALLGTRLKALLPIGDQILLATHCMPLLQMTGAVAEVAVEVVAADRTRRSALLSAVRTPPTGDGPALVRVAVFSAHERRRYEKELLAARRRAEASEAERASAQAELAHLVLHDALTGLPNRAGLQARLAGHLAGGPAGTRLAVLFVDLDHFKAVNDSLGHAAGDALLRVVADRLSGALRAGATLARLSGDEFVVLEAVAGPQDAAALAGRLLGALEGPVVIEGLDVAVGASIGVALAESGSDDGDRLLRRADIAMYRAKARGRGCYELHDPDQRDPEVDRLRLLGELRHAIADGQLRVHYQPRYDLSDGSLQGVEALVRWQHPERGLLPPAAFIDVAEQTGLIVALGAWVLDAAVAQAARWHRERPEEPPVEMAVNVSARQLGDPGLVDLVAGVLERHGLDPSALTLEITETALMVDADRALATLHELKALGIRLSVDDFGTGYASLTYLKHFPVDELKIDRSFVAGLGVDGEDTAIIASCIQLAHAVGVRAVAEGVETEQQRRALVAMACDLAQGFLLGRPSPARPAGS